MEVFFEKWHGCKNDFILIWSTTNQLQYLKDSLRRRAPFLCSKKGDGIGADGIIICETQLSSDCYPQRVHVINQDGSEARNCGNGLRCAAMSTKKRIFEQNKDHLLQESIELKIEGRSFLCTFLDTKQVSKEESASEPCVFVEMDAPLLDERATDEWSAIQKQMSGLIKKEGGGLAIEEWNLCRLGNLHAIFFCSKEPKEEDAFHFAKLLQKESFWDGINVHIVFSQQVDSQLKPMMQKVFGKKQPDEALKAFVWERGVGPTPACGSGAASIGAAYFKKGFMASDTWLPIAMPGGNLYVKPTDQDGGSMVLAGPAVFVFKGSFSI